MTRAALLEVLEEPYVAVARAKGVSGFVVLYKHALRNALISLVTVLGLLAAQLVAGSILVENVFYLPGLGRLVVQAIGERDLPVVQGAIVVIALLIALVNFGVDLAYGFLDPRVRYR
jgi:peptide/nickel transport system permease protein